MSAILPPWIVLDPLLNNWLQEDIGRGDRTTLGIFKTNKIQTKGYWIAKEAGTIAGLPLAQRVFEILDKFAIFIPLITEGKSVSKGETIAEFSGAVQPLLTGERVALNLVMHLSGIATMTNKYVREIADLPTQLVDTRKTTPGLRILEKYATAVGGGGNHRMGLDDAVMIKDNHIQAAGGIKNAVYLVRQNIPYTTTVEVETTNLTEVTAAIEAQANIIMLDNMQPEMMKEAVQLIKASQQNIKIEASGNVTLDNIRIIAETGVDYISTSATITRSRWLDLSMRFG
ncbi:putative nicotinate-nucleotide pyrophosphorylase (carboxylating) [Hyella patelloides LEGE 07179]|uniref:Probable nicotinate-nucleotide pyrophosphorylase [carboxylating] n=1 Tax=Hyella patelloides LEGE 07179 TaxID=945734 RepID=A0A563W3Y0_9CYAN|nr:carboxylating nicotinate-nucleotide diphosphorylase [Hyella patelloides]VEP18384.1 putative nicotinate-nucleotide pyrophosphorylase (carboxylating) [Hyella patelloides LEGE 07179]